MRRMTLMLVAILTMRVATVVTAQQPGGEERFSFVVLGHLRGDLSGPNPKLGEVLGEAASLEPDLVFLTGDMIWGDVNRDPVDSILVEREWDTLDSALATVAPAYRTPGNHDVNDRVTRDIYLARYGPLPQSFTFGGSRFILLSSAWMPADEEEGKHEYIRGKEIDAVQIDFLRAELADTGTFEHAFVFLHHLLWWGDESSSWWREIHPVLEAGKVAAVFSGDYGPMKFSHLSRDGVHYYQSSIEDTVSISIQQDLPSSWRLSSQFDNFLHVAVDGPEVDVTVHTVSETSLGTFAPDRWQLIDEGSRRPIPVTTQVWTIIGSSKRIVGLLLAVVLYTLFVAVVARRWRRTPS